MKQTVLTLTLFLCVGAGLVFLGCGGGTKRGTGSTTNVGLVVSSMTGISVPSAESTTDPEHMMCTYLNPTPMGLAAFSTLSESANPKI